MNKRLVKVAAAREKIDDEFLAATLEALDKAAREENLDSMCFYFKTTLKRDGEEVESELIQKIEYFYLDNCCDTGFLEGWNKEDGWGDPTYFKGSLKPKAGDWVRWRSNGQRWMVDAQDDLDNPGTALSEKEWYEDVIFEKRP